METPALPPMPNGSLDQFQTLLFVVSDDGEIQDPRPAEVSALGIVRLFVKRMEKLHMDMTDYRNDLVAAWSEYHGARKALGPSHYSWRSGAEAKEAIAAEKANLLKIYEEFTVVFARLAGDTTHPVIVCKMKDALALCDFYAGRMMGIAAVAETTVFVPEEAMQERIALFKDQLRPGEVMLRIDAVRHILKDAEDARVRADKEAVDAASAPAFSHARRSGEPKVEEVEDEAVSPPPPPSPHAPVVREAESLPEEIVLPTPPPPPLPRTPTPVPEAPSTLMDAAAQARIDAQMDDIRAAIAEAHIEAAEHNFLEVLTQEVDLPPLLRRDSIAYDSPLTSSGSTASNGYRSS